MKRLALVVWLSACGTPSVPDAGLDGSGTDQALVGKCLACHDQVGASWSQASTHSLLFDCSTCHVETRPSGERHASSRACGECHGARNHRGFSCTDCHDVHGSTNLFLLRPHAGGEDLVLTSPELITGDGTGPCEVCHTGTTHYRRDGSGTEHPTEWCITCHSHQSGFLPDAG